MNKTFLYIAIAVLILEILICTFIIINLILINNIKIQQQEYWSEYVKSRQFDCYDFLNNDFFNRTH